MMTIDQLPDVKLTANGNFRQAQALTVPNVAAVLKHMGIGVRFNVMLAQAEFFTADGPVPSNETGMLFQKITDQVVMLDMPAGRLDEILKEIGARAPFHPMEDWLRGLKWDGRDRIGELTMAIKTDNPLWPTYFENWLVQVVEGVCGWRREFKSSLPYVLVLVGSQGVGKTHFFRQLGGPWIKPEAELHLSSPSGKDHQLDVLRRPMAELAELDGIFRKSDISHMKAFISREEDAIRAPYDRRPTIRPRMTVFCGSVNDAEFLTDSSGSRRFWPVQVDAIDWSVKVDLDQLWAQAFEYWGEDAGFHLSAEEDAQRARLAVDIHTSISPEAEKIAAYYAMHVGQVEEKAMNRTEILEMLGFRNMSPRVVAEAGRWLVENVGKHRTLGKKKRAWMFPYNEFASDLETWPINAHITGIDN